MLLQGELHILREKLGLFDFICIDRVHVCRFNVRFAQTSAAGFIHALHEKLSAKFVLIADDFRFGSGRAGDFALEDASRKVREGVGLSRALVVCGLFPPS